MCQPATFLSHESAVCNIEHVCNMWCGKAVVRIVFKIVHGDVCKFVLSDDVM